MCVKKIECVNYENCYLELCGWMCKFLVFYFFKYLLYNGIEIWIDGFLFLFFVDSFF